MPGFYTPNLKKDDKNYKISGEEFHHITNVRRRSIGDIIKLTNGKGLLCDARISEITKKFVIADIVEAKEFQSSHPKIAAAFSLLKSKNDLLIIEKLTELGVKEFFPLMTERSVRKISANTNEKFRKVSVAAIKQCDNAHLPKIHKPLELNKALDFIRSSGFIPIIALEYGEQMSLKQALDQVGDQNSCLIIGPEGGFSPGEIELFKKKDIISITLGNHILRAETAAIAIISQTLNYQLEKDPNYY